jgi:hypothetical protein
MTSRWPMPGARRCGAVRIRASAPPLITLACHCRGCQRMSSSAFSLTAMFAADAFAVIDGSPVQGGKPGNGMHHFCGTCMSWMFTRPPGMDFVNVRPTMFDATDWFVPFAESYTCEKLPWASTPATHSFERFPPMEQYQALIAEYARLQPQR